MIYISILRGINVSGHNIIKMEALRLLYSELGFQQVQTYIQSGNVIFQYSKSNQNKLEEKITTAIKHKFGFDVPVIVKEFEEFQKVVSENPFLKDKANDSKFFYVTFLSQKPEIGNYNKLKEFKALNEKIELIDNALYFYCPDGYGNTKLSNSFIEKKLKMTATTRNWNTLNALIQKAEKLQAKV